MCSAMSVNALDTNCRCWFPPTTGNCLDAQEGLIAEAALLRESEANVKARLWCLPEGRRRSSVAHAAASVAAWRGLPIERMSQNDWERFVRWELAHKVLAGPGSVRRGGLPGVHEGAAAGVAGHDVRWCSPLGDARSDFKWW